MKATSKYNLAKLHPNLAKEWHPTKNKPLTPEQVSPGSGQKVWWRCPTKKPNHEWSAIVASRVNGSGCPYCAGKKVCADNNLKFLYPDLAKEWHPTKNGDLNPSDVTPGNNQKVWWKCEKYPEHEWEATIYDRTRSDGKATGCPECYRIRRSRR